VQVDADGVVGGDGTGAMAAVLAGLQWDKPWILTVTATAPYTEGVEQTFTLNVGGVGLTVGTTGATPDEAYAQLLLIDGSYLQGGAVLTSPFTVTVTSDGTMLVLRINGQMMGSGRLGLRANTNVTLLCQVLATAHLHSIRLEEIVQAADAYITQTDLEDAIAHDSFLEVFDRDDDGGADSAVVAAAIDAAVAEVHGYLARRYQLPLDTSDQVLMAFLKPGLVDLAFARGHPRADMVSSKLQGRVDEFLGRLKDIRDGKADLPATAPPAAPANANSGVVWSANKRKTLGGMP